MDDQALRRELLELLYGRGAHMGFDEAVADFPVEALNRRPPNVPYSPWQLLEHLRLTQRDIVEYVQDPGAYTERAWPEEYWPAPDATASQPEFEATLEGFRADREALRKLVEDPSIDVLAVLPATPGHSLAREIRVVGDHNAYHIGEFAILRQVMGTWPAGRSE